MKLKGSSLVILIIVMLLIYIGCAKKPDKTAQGYWDSAVELFENQNFEECVAEYKLLVKFYPEDTLAVKALFAMAEIYKNNLTDLDNSISIYTRITKNYADSQKAPNAQFMIGYIYANDLNDYEKARAEYNKFIERYPEHVLVPSAKWELDNLGKTLEEIPQLETLTKDL